MSEPDVVNRREGDFATITMNRPQRRNALSLEMLRSLLAAFEQVGASDARGVVLAGTGPVFSAGHDFADVAGADYATVRTLLRTCTDLMRLMQQIPQPVVAESAGFAAPGGKGGWFCHTPMVPIARSIGRKRAFELALSGEVIDARTAAEWGLVNRVVPDAQLDAAVQDLLECVTRGSAESKGIGKQALYAQLELGQVEAYDYAVEVMAATCQLPDAQQGMRAFLEKRQPAWRRGR